MSAQIIPLAWCWRVRWADEDGNERITLVPPCEKHIARISVAVHYPQFYEFVGEPQRVVRKA